MISLRRKKLFCCTLLLLLFFTGMVAAEENSDGESLRFTYEEGERYRILSSVEQNVFVDGRFSHSAEILNRIHVTIKDTDGDRGYMLLDYESGETVDFQPGVYHLRDRYESEFWRDERGIYEFDDDYFVPVVRDVPVWPEKPLQEGDTWTHEGYEVHDFREPFGVSEPYRFSVPVQYEYKGRETIDGRPLDIISIEYNVYHRSREREQERYPATVGGYSRQEMYFDSERGRPAFYEEEFELEVRLNDGSHYRFAGTAEARVLESEPLDREKVQDDITEELERLKIPEAGVEDDERGITISLSDIQFPPDSAELRSSEREKIEQLGKILQEYPEHDIMVTGHTADAGTKEGRQALSEKRAAAVGNALLEMGVRDPDRLLYRGRGAEDPVASNDTEEGRRQNRRVEFTIIED